jgi:hypothetical protein
LLSRLPEPENLSAYREKVVNLVAKQQRELSAHQGTSKLLGVTSFVVALLAISGWARNRGVYLVEALGIIAGVLFFVYAIDVLRVFMRRNQVELLKEVKQVQLQVLELHASLQKDNGR